MRAPTKEEMDQMRAHATELEVQLMEALKAWAGSLYQVGFAAGAEAASGAGLILPNRPKLEV